MDKQETLERIDLEIGLTKDMNLDNPLWTPDYREGFIDGLNRVKELIDELYPPVEITTPLMKQISPSHISMLPRKEKTWTRHFAEILIVLAIFAFMFALAFVLSH